jgi:REP element-mobilizing transposase RayT
MRPGFSPTGIIQKKKGDTKMTFWRLHYHIIWATFQRERFLAGDREKMFYGVLYKKGRELGLTVHAAGNVEDHVHIVISIPPSSGLQPPPVAALRDRFSQRLPSRSAQVRFVP